MSCQISHATCKTSILFQILRDSKLLTILIVLQFFPFFSRSFFSFVRYDVRQKYVILVENLCMNVYSVVCILYKMVTSWYLCMLVHRFYYLQVGHVRIAISNSHWKTLAVAVATLYSRDKWICCCMQCRVTPFPPTSLPLQAFAFNFYFHFISPFFLFLNILFANFRIHTISKDRYKFSFSFSNKFIVN